jgi:hypothetical protein
MGENEAAGVLEKTLRGEKDTDEKLTELSEEINSRAFTGNGSEAESQNGETKVRQRAAKGRSSVTFLGRPGSARPRSLKRNETRIHNWIKRRGEGKLASQSPP